MRFGLLPFRSPLLRESLLISFPGLLRWFTSPSFASVPYFIQVFRCWNRSQRVTPFGYLRLIEYVLLPAAFRSLSRPSSPYSSIGIRHRPIFRLTILFFLFRICTLSAAPHAIKPCTPATRLQCYSFTLLNSPSGLLNTVFLHLSFQRT